MECLSRKRSNGSSRLRVKAGRIVTSPIARGYLSAGCSSSIAYTGRQALYQYSGGQGDQRYRQRSMRGEPSRRPTTGSGCAHVILRRLYQLMASRSINHNRIHKVLKEEGLALSEPRKWKRRKWIRYEREHSNSLWHTDWHQIKDPRWRGQWLIGYEDDSSRLMAGYGASISNTDVPVLRRCPR